MNPLAYLNRQKGNAADLIGAFARGSGAEVTEKLEYVPGRDAVFWGVDKATLPVWEACAKALGTYWYVDNGYFGSKWAGGDHYRITFCGEQCLGHGTSDGKRWRVLGLKINPWLRSGRHVLVACQSDFWHERHGQKSAAAFGADMRSKLSALTDRPVIVRGKPIGGHKEPPVAEHLRDCWAVVTHSSIVAAEALLAGIPAFVLSHGCMSTMCPQSIEDIERPFYPDDRERWASVLADNQWRLGEIKDGTAWRALHA